ncbi:MAG: carbon monoxide dehydrogenase [Bacteroidetes bacterium]|nr:MAG: carbon monoxide dehydrogenase [Bacteroidota bacterium]
MQTTISNTFFIEEPIDKVWASLSDPMEVVTCVPGASITEKIDDTHYKGAVTLKFGPVKAEYAGEIEILESDPSAHRLVLKGVGLDAKGKGQAEMTMNGHLTEKDGGTEVSFTMDVSIVGMLAQFGSRLINDVSDHLLKQFVSNFKAKLSGGEVDNTASAGSIARSVLKEKVGGLFRKEG